MKKIFFFFCIGMLLVGCSNSRTFKCYEEGNESRIYSITITENYSRNGGETYTIKYAEGVAEVYYARTTRDNDGYWYHGTCKFNDGNATNCMILTDRTIKTILQDGVHMNKIKNCFIMAFGEHEYDKSYTRYEKMYILTK